MARMEREIDRERDREAGRQKDRIGYSDGVASMFTCQCCCPHFAWLSRCIAGESLNPAIDIGQAQGAWVMGLGYFFREDLLTCPKTGDNRSPDTWEYKVRLMAVCLFVCLSC